MLQSCEKTTCQAALCISSSNCIHSEIFMCLMYAECPLTCLRILVFLIFSCFSGQPKRILGWFENFSSSLKKENLLGAQALAHFAFIHRDRYWKELEWKGSHGQSPAIVASKPYYFLDLDVLKTVENFLDYIPEFWSSDELWDSLRDGDIVSLDINYFIEKLFQRMKDGCSDVWKMLEHFLSEEEFSGLCRHLLSFLSDEQLLGFINNLRFVLSQSRSASQR
mgnify:FL=1